MTELERPHIERLVWDDWNRDHVAKHDVTPAESEEVVVGDSLVRASYKGRLFFLGPTIAGRMLVVVAGPVPGGHDAYYVFSARPASRKERRYYEEQRGATL